MSNENLNILLKEYEHKRVVAELDLEKRRDALYSSIPKLYDIDSEINSYALKTTKSILLNNNKSFFLENLNKKIDTLKKKKEQLLIANGYEPSYLKPQYDCPTCNDTGFINQNNKKVMCNCLKQRLLDISYNNSNLLNLKNENFSNFDANVFSDKVSSSKYGQDISPRENILNIKDRALEFIDNFDDPSYKNLLFTGNTGSR